MERKVGLVCAADVLFLLLLVLSGTLSGALSEAVYFLAFLLPASLALLVARRSGDIYEKPLLSLDLRGLRLFLPLTVPVLLAVFAVSFAVSYIAYLAFGVTGGADIGDDLLLALILHALLPAVFEEMLFRYVPLRIFGYGSGAAAVFIPSLFFALVHVDILSMPHAFLAGVAFTLIDMMCESVWPSVILHFLNNAFSVLWIFYSTSVGFLLLAVLIVFLAVSVGFICKKREEYISGVKLALLGRKLKFYPQILYLAVPALTLAVAAFLSKL